MASKSDLYIFVDGAKNEEDKLKVNEVIDIVQSIDKKKFKNVFLNIKKENYGLANSVISGVSSVIEKHKKVIVLEDDLLTSPRFLSFMNEALNEYEHNDKIWSISGYTPNLRTLNNRKMNSSVFEFSRGSSWGWATWLPEWKNTIWDIDYFPKYSIKSYLIFKEAGVDFPYMLESQRISRIDSWAVRWCATELLLGKYTIYPVKTLVENIGMDGTGTHSSVKSVNKFNSTIENNDLQKIKFEKNSHNRIIVKEFRRLYGSPLKMVSHFIRYMFNSN